MPVPFHEVRTRLLRQRIASPVMSVSPIKVVQDLWGGKLPPFDKIEDANELVGALVMGLRNRLTRHARSSLSGDLTVVAVGRAAGRRRRLRPSACTHPRAKSG